MPLTPTNVSASDGAYRDGILVTWSYPGNVNEVARWDIYRWKDSEAPRFYYSVFGSTLQYADLFNVFGFSQDVTAKYNYAVRAYSYTSGSSEISQADSGFVARNNAPTFSSSSLSVSTNEDQSKQIPLTASDKDGDILNYTVSKSASNGSVIISGGSATYTPKENFNGSDTFTVKVSDAWGGYSTQIIDVTVKPVNDNPIFLSSFITQNNKLIADPSGSTVFKVSAFDVDGDQRAFSVGNAAYGQVSISGNTITYSTNGNSIKSDSFEVSVSDGNGGVAKQKIDVVIGTPAAPSSSLLPKSGSDTIDMMLNGYRWYGDTIYYSFSVGADGSSIPIDPVKFEKDLKFIFDTAFGLYLDAQFVFVGFFESPEYAYYSGSNINIALDRTNFSSPNILGRANFPVINNPLSTFPSSYRGSEGDVFININGPANTLAYAPGTEGFLLLLHEIGHALGLKHPHDDGGSGRPTFSDLELNDLNIDWWTIMSYDDDSSSLYYWDPTTPMVLDVIALQYLYGASDNASGDNYYDLRFNVPAYFTIFDSAGSDILDFRNADEAVYVELPTLWINRFQEYPIGIALPLSDFYRSAPTYLTWLYGDFEEIQGSSYSDDITGSQNADKIFGNSGNDAIRGGSGSDTIDGGYGTDTVFFADLFSECTVTFDGDQCVVTTRTEGTDRLINVEKLSFGPTGSLVEYSVASLKNQNPAFAASAQSISTDEDKAKTITVSATDADGDSLTYTVSRAPTNGTANVSGSTVTYTPAPNYNGTDSFVVTASDGKGGTAAQTVNISVAAVNDAPTFSASSQSIIANAGVAKTIALSASDVDGDALTYAVAAPSKGTVSISGNTLTYTPASSSLGTDSFVITASDGRGGTATQTVGVTIDDYPDTTGSKGLVAINGVASSGSIDFADDTDVFKVTLTVGETYKFALTATAGSLDPYLFLFDPKVSQVASNGDYGSSKNSQITYTALVSGSFYLLAADTATSLGSYSLTAELINRPPAFSNPAQSVSTNEDASKSITISATDADNDALTYTISTAASHGTTSLSGGTIAYTPAANFNGSDSFVVTANDGKGGTATQTINVTVAPVNDAPTFPATSQAVSATAGTAKTITLSATDVDGDTLTYTVATPGKGTASISDNTLTYTPSSTASGSDSFVITASDGNGGTATQTINATISAALAPKAFTIYTKTGWVGSVGGNGTVLGTNGFEDVSVLYGQVSLDGSFSRGTDILRVPGDGDDFMIGRSNASTAFLEAGNAVRVSVPMGSLGLGVVFTDGVRKLVYSGGYKIGGQSFTAEGTQITAAADGTPLPAGADTSAQASVFLNSAGLSGGSAPDITLSGKARILGTNGIDVIKLADAGADLVFDGSFGRGGDIIILTKAAADYQAARLNASTLVLTSDDERLTIPVGTKGLTLRFADEERVLIYKSGALHIGDQPFSSATATALTPSTISLSLDQGTPNDAVTLDGAGKVIFTDNASQTTNVILANFGKDDLIRVTGATALQYNFTLSSQDPRDLEITFTDPVTSASNLIVLDNVIANDTFVGDYETAAQAVGFNFMAFG